MKHLLYISALILALIASSCDKNDDPVPPEPGPTPENPMPKSKHTILVYAIAANNLSSNLDLDMKEMLTGMNGIDTDSARLFVYKVQLDPVTQMPTTPELLQAVKASFGTTWKTIKSYGTPQDSLIRSTDKQRISDVINYVHAISPSDEFGVIFWSHSDAWNPSPNYVAPPQRSFGQERVGSKSYYCEITDLAEAIPAGIVDFIWFDSCYMANIETAYQMRDKCRYMVGSAIELDAYGMPYDVTLPVFFSDKPLSAAAKATYDYFIIMNRPVTMAVMDMSHIEEVADAAADASRNFRPLDDIYMLQRYSRSLNPVLYDFGQYIDLLSGQNGTDALPMKEALGRFVIYKASSSYGWSGTPINEALYSGVSCHAYQATDSKADTFYRTLDWYDRVYGAE